MLTVLAQRWDSHEAAMMALHLHVRYLILLSASQNENYDDDEGYMDYDDGGDGEGIF